MDSGLCPNLEAQLEDVTVHSSTTMLSIKQDHQVDLMSKASVK